MGNRERDLPNRDHTPLSILPCSFPSPYLSATAFWLVTFPVKDQVCCGFHNLIDSDWQCWQHERRLSSPFWFKRRSKFWLGGQKYLTSPLSTWALPGSNQWGKAKTKQRNTENLSREITTAALMWECSCWAPLFIVKSWFRKYVFRAFKIP